MCESDICLASKFASTIVVTNALGNMQTFQGHLKIKVYGKFSKRVDGGGLGRVLS